MQTREKLEEFLVRRLSNKMVKRFQFCFYFIFILYFYSNSLQPNNNDNNNNNNNNNNNTDGWNVTQTLFLMLTIPKDFLK